MFLYPKHGQKTLRTLSFHVQEPVAGSQLAEVIARLSKMKKT